MSVEVMVLALYHSKASATDKVVLLGIANHHGDGGAWPSLETLARYANVSERQVSRSIKVLEDLGELKRCSGSSRRPLLLYVELSGGE